MPSENLCPVAKCKKSCRHHHKKFFVKYEFAINASIINQKFVYFTHLLYTGLLSYQDDLRKKERTIRDETIYIRMRREMTHFCRLIISADILI